jgi:phospholipid/cholesterol/gamma-HCH transport system substrate-binding protein
LDSTNTREGRTREPLADERGSTVARAIAVAALVAAVALVAIALFGGGGSYQVKAVFQSAGQLVRGNQVRVGGQPVGTITDITLNDKAQAVVTMKINDDIAPLHQGSSATIRATSLSGIANRYISVKPGPNNATKIDDGGQIGADRTSSPVDIDVLFNTLDSKTRQGLKDFIRGQADWYQGRAPQAAASSKYLPAYLVSTTNVTRELSLDQAVFRRFLTDTAKTMSSLAERRNDLAGLVTNTNQTAAAIGDENVALSRALQLLPSTLRKANTTFVNLRSTLDDLDVLVNASKPGTRQLAAFLARLRPVVREARPTVADLAELIRRPGANNDLIDLTAKQPKLASLTASIFPRAIRTLDRAQPVVEYARGYTPDLAGWFTKFGQVAGVYDANGHYARVMPVFSPTQLTGSSLTASAPSQRLDAFQKGKINRCPGGNVQPSPDGSTPYAFSGCDTSTTPPGP